MSTLNNTSCCGLKELSGVRIGKPEEVLKRICCRWYCRDRDGGFIVFSDTVSSTKGKKFRDYIIKNNLGEVVTTTKHAWNPNSGNKLNVWLWNVNKRVLRRFHNKLNKANSRQYEWGMCSNCS